MYVKIRKWFAKPGEEDLTVNISKMALVGELRGVIKEKMGFDVEKQRLYYKGKQLVDDHRMMDYDIRLNDVIQLMIKEIEATPTEQAEKEQEEKEAGEQVEAAEEDSASSGEPEKATSDYYKVGDAVDVIDPQYGAWFEARIIDIFKRRSSATADSKKHKEPHLIFQIKMDSETEDGTFDVAFDDIRPRSYYTYPKSELSVDQTVLVNYNIENPTTRGYWYNFIIQQIKAKQFKGRILVGKSEAPIEDCNVKFVEEVMRIEKPDLLSNQSNEEVNASLQPRKNTYYCEKCKDVSEKPCKYCGCKICSGKDKADEIVLCDECDFGYHLRCLDPPLEEVPTDPDWYCPSCKINADEIVKAGDKLKFNSKKAKMPSATSSRDWDRGMACAGRTKECTIVPKDHFGPIPGVEVGTCWKYRMQVSEAGIHRPHVAGIHGCESKGAFSIVLSGGYEDDIDYGNEFLYTGSGGRDLSGNKRVSDQSSDQKLTRMNKALALNCSVPLNEQGGEATDWQKGKPVRVVRNYKITKHSKFGPKDGNRYDGIYKVVKYYPEKGKSGFLVWRYLLRRDDPTSAPWEKGGQEFDIIYPAGYEEAKAASDEAKENRRSSKRKAPSDDEDSEEPKKKKAKPYMLSGEMAKDIKAEKANEKLWEECKEQLKSGKGSFLLKVEELFMCIVCQEVVYLPISTECKHNVCKGCLKKSFASEIYNCPNCRFELGDNYKMEVNDTLSKILLDLFPGYQAHR